MINQIIEKVQSVTTSKTEIQTLTVEDFGTVIKYVAVVPVPTGVQQLVYYFNKETEVVSTISTETVAVLKTPVFYTETVNAEGQTVIASSSIEKIVAIVPETTKAIDLLVKTYS